MGFAVLALVGLAVVGVLVERVHAEPPACLAHAPRTEGCGNCCQGLKKPSVFENYYEPTECLCSIKVSEQCRTRLEGNQCSQCCSDNFNSVPKLDENGELLEGQCKCQGIRDIELKACLDVERQSEECSHCCKTLPSPTTPSPLIGVFGPAKSCMCDTPDDQCEKISKESGENWQEECKRCCKFEFSTFPEWDPLRYGYCNCNGIRVRTEQSTASVFGVGGKSDIVDSKAGDTGKADHSGLVEVIRGADNSGMADNSGKATRERTSDRSEPLIKIIINARM